MARPIDRGSIRRPRQKPEGDTVRPRHILTERGVGYRFRADPG